MTREQMMRLFEKPEDFVIAEILEGDPDGLDDKILFDLWDITLKFGDEIEGGYIYKGREDGLCLKVNEQPPSLEIFTYDARPPVHAIVLMLKHKLLVKWDGRISARKIKCVIQEIDFYAEKFGDIIKGVRQIVPGRIRPAFSSNSGANCA